MIKGDIKIYKQTKRTAGNAKYVKQLEKPNREKYTAHTGGNNV